MPLLCSTLELQVVVGEFWYRWHWVLEKCWGCSPIVFFLCSRAIQICGVHVVVRRGNGVVIYVVPFGLTLACRDPLFACCIPIWWWAQSINLRPNFYHMCSQVWAIRLDCRGEFFRHDWLRSYRLTGKKWWGGYYISIILALFFWMVDMFSETFN